MALVSLKMTWTLYEKVCELSLRSRKCQQTQLTFAIDPVAYLPTELMCHILSFLDAESVKSAELVSSAWNAQASSRHVWREVFLNEHNHRSHATNNKSGKSKPMGLGKLRPNQDWKKMYAVRRALESRWKDGKAAAIYLHGHKDSVYCVQFDEYVIAVDHGDELY